MLNFVLNNWKRKKIKFLLTLLGALIISAGLSLMFNLTDSSQGTVEQTLQKKWSSAYDIVVRPSNSTLNTESNNLLEPNYLNGINGGISFKQYEKIKQIQEVDVAAPVAVMGYVKLGLQVPDQLRLPDKPGIYRLTEKQTDQTGFGQDKLYDVSQYAIKNQKIQIPRIPTLHAEDDKNDFIIPRVHSLIVAIDPKEEAKLVGLDHSVLSHSGKYRYFDENDKPVTMNGDKNTTTIPILLNPNSFNKGIHKYSVERLNVPFTTKQEQESFFSSLPAGKKALSALKNYDSQTIKSFSITSNDVEKTLFDLLLNQKPSKDISKHLDGAVASNFSQIELISDSLQYQTEKSPFPARWKNAYRVESEKIQVSNPDLNISGALPQSGYRSAHSLETKKKDDMSNGYVYSSPNVFFNIVGLYDPKKIRVSKDPLNELPMETYRPAAADIVLDSKDKPVNPSKPVNTSGNPVGLLTSSPNLLTTIESAKKVRGENSISSIRIKVAGATKVGEASEKLLQKVKSQIEQETGLLVTITKGSSPQPVVTKVVTDGKTLGWIEQPWIHIGAAMTIFRETSVGFSGVIFAMLAVAIVYVLATSYVSMLARRKEFAVLLALGWRTKDLYKIVMIEALLLASFVSFIALLVEGIFSYVKQEPMNLISLLWIVLFSLAIYLAGAAWSAWTIRRISPYEAIKTGEYARAAHVSLKLRSTVTLSLKELFGKWKRNVLSILSIALPTSLLTFFLFVTFHLQGVLYTSWLGQFVALQVGPMHYVTMGVAIAIAILTTGEIMWQNVSDRRASLAVLKAVGWSNRSVRQLIVLEGVLIGFIAGILGIIVTYISIYTLYDLVPWDRPSLIAVSLLMPVIFGSIAALIPAQIAAKVNPYKELKEAA